MDCFVYILGCRGKGRRLTYVGWTTDVERRFNQHNGGTGARFTRGRAWVLLHVERFATRREAMSREWHLKRDRKFRKQIAQTIAARA
jgi:putative endonuclease